MTGPLISVVVCSFNGADKIRGCLTALEKQSQRENLEIIVVDDGSSDDTSRVAATFPGVDVVVLPTNQGLSAARNAGVARASAPFIAFTDDDCRPSPPWIADLLEAWRNSPDYVMAIGGSVAAASTTTFNQRFLDFRVPLAPTRAGVGAAASFPQRMRTYLARSNHVRRNESVQAVQSLVGANMSFRATGLAAVGGFDPRRTFGGDEDYVCRRLREKFGEHCVVCVPSIVVDHEFATSVKDTIRRAYAYGRGLGRTFAHEGGIPSLQPLALMVFATLVVGRRRWWLPLGTALVAPVAANHDCVSEARRSRRLEVLAYPYAILVEEAALNIGLVVGYLRTKISVL